jgi:hypothetical protein
LVRQSGELDTYRSPTKLELSEAKKTYDIHDYSSEGLNCWYLLLCCEFAYPADIIGFIEEFVENSYRQYIQSVARLITKL